MVARALESTSVGKHKPTCHYQFMCRVAQVQERHGDQEQAPARVLYLSWNRVVILKAIYEVANHRITEDRHSWFLEDRST